MLRENVTVVRSLSGNTPLCLGDKLKTLKSFSNHTDIERDFLFSFIYGHVTSKPLQKRICKTLQKVVLRGDAPLQRT